MKWRSHKQRGVGTVSEGPVQPAPFCCHAKTAPLTGTVPLFTHQPQIHAHPETNMAAAHAHASSQRQNPCNS